MVVLVIIGLATVGSFPKRVEGVFGIQMDPCTHSAIMGLPFVCVLGLLANKNG